MTEARTDVLGRLAEGPCPDPDCGGTLEHGSYKETAAVVCPDCGAPAARTWER